MTPPSNEEEEQPLFDSAGNSLSTPASSTQSLLARSQHSYDAILESRNAAAGVSAPATASKRGRRKGAKTQAERIDDRLAETEARIVERVGGLELRTTKEMRGIGRKIGEIRDMLGELRPGTQSVAPTVGIDAGGRTEERVAQSDEGETDGPPEDGRKAGMPRLRSAASSSRLEEATHTARLATPPSLCFSRAPSPAGLSWSARSRSLRRESKDAQASGARDRRSRSVSVGHRSLSHSPGRRRHHSRSRSPAREPRRPPPRPTTRRPTSSSTGRTAVPLAGNGREPPTAPSFRRRQRGTLSAGHRFVRSGTGPSGKPVEAGTFTEWGAAKRGGTRDGKGKERAKELARRGSYDGEQFGEDGRE